MKTLLTDYLIIGSGAMGMAFADILLSETDASMIIVDRYPKPGGHWNVAYPFVRLHQPSAFYGVSSRELGSGKIEKGGLNDGLGELASGPEVSAYYDTVMRQTFLPSGRVSYFPMCNYDGENEDGDGQFTARVSGESYTVKAKKIVDCTALKTSVPSTHTPNFTIADGLRFMPLNDLPSLTEPPEGFVVIGAGKTGIDACLWLLEHNVNPNHIRWIKPRDAWLLDRKNTQPAAQFFSSTMEAQAAQFESIANSDSLEDMFGRLEACGYFLRIYKDTRPTMFHGATISQAEAQALRRIKNIIRMGRVQALNPTEIILDDGVIPTSANIVHIDCSARAIADYDIVDIFQGRKIIPQMVRSYQPVFSAAFIAHIEASRDTDKEKNRLCGVVPLPNSDTDYLRFTAAFMVNQYNWGQDKEIRNWLLHNRLDGFSKLVKSISKTDVEKMAIMERLRANSFPAMAKLQSYIAELDARA